MKILFLLCCCLFSCAGPPPPFHAKTLAEEGHPVVFQAVNGRYLRLNMEGVLVADAITIAEADTLIWRDIGPPLFTLQVGNRYVRAHGHYNYAVNAQSTHLGFGERFIWHESAGKTYFKTSSNHYVGLGDDGSTMVVQHYHPVGGSPLQRIDL